MNYLKPSFSVTLGGDAYADGWERIFGEKPPSAPPAEDEPPRKITFFLRDGFEYKDVAPGFFYEADEDE